MFRIESEPFQDGRINGVGRPSQREFAVRAAAQLRDLNELGVHAAPSRILSQLLKRPSIEEDYGCIEDQVTQDRQSENAGPLFQNELGAPAPRLYVGVQRFKHGLLLTDRYVFFAFGVSEVF